MKLGDGLLSDVHPPVDFCFSKGIDLDDGKYRLDGRAGVYADMLFTFLESLEASTWLEANGFEVFEEECVEWREKGLDRFVWSTSYAKNTKIQTGIP
jgi:hypothetical protein